MELQCIVCTLCSQSTRLGLFPKCFIHCRVYYSLCICFLFIFRAISGSSASGSRLLLFKRSLFWYNSNVVFYWVGFCCALPYTLSLWLCPFLLCGCYMNAIQYQSKCYAPQACGYGTLFSSALLLFFQTSRRIFFSACFAWRRKASSYHARVHHHFSF